MDVSICLRRTSCTGTSFDSAGESGVIGASMQEASASRTVTATFLPRTRRKPLRRKVLLVPGAEVETREPNAGAVPTTRRLRFAIRAGRSFNAHLACPLVARLPPASSATRGAWTDRGRG